MKRIVLKITAAFCISFAFALFSCSEITQKIYGGGQDTESEQEFTITGTLSVDVDGAIPSEIAKSVYGGSSSLGLENSARTAVPSLPTSITYRVTATSTSGKTTKDGDFTVSGNNFTIKLSSTANETWTVKAEGYSDSDKTTKILEGSSEEFSLKANEVKNPIPTITLYQISSGNGNVSLPISVASDSGIQSAIVKVFEDFAGTKQITVTPALEYDFSTEKSTTISANLASGTRYFVITFYSVDLQTAKTNPNQNVAYKVHETVNIFQNLTTDTWQENDSYLKGGQFLVTKALVDTFSKNIDDKIFYVAGTDSSFSVNADDSDDNDGTNPFRPFATLQKAVDKVTKINDGTSTYTIKVDGMLTQSSAATYGNPESFVNISSDKNLNLTIEGITSGATIDANIIRTGSGRNGRVFCISGNRFVNINVILKNLTLKGGHLSNSSAYGAGIYLEKGNLTLSSVTVTDNACGKGGGIYIGNDAKLMLNGCTVSNNTATQSGGGIFLADSSSCNITNETIISGNSGGDKTENDGGGIYLEKNANLTLNGCTISNNTALSGGGISVVSSRRIDITNSEISGNTATDRGGGIFVGGDDASLILNEGTKISKNSAKNGGGIYVFRNSVASNGSLSITNSEISENTATDNGGGIYIVSGRGTITNGTISGNSAQTSGGGICVADSGDCTINGGTILGNSAASKGGGVCLTNSGSTITISGTDASPTTMSGNRLTNTAQQETGTAIFVGKGATTEIRGNISITPGTAQGGALPTIYLEKGQQAQPGGIRGTTPQIPDGALKLGGIVQIGSGGNTGIKMEKALQDTANIKITGSLVTAQTINISYAGVQNNNSIIEGEGHALTDDDCRKFTVNNSHQLTLNNNKGVYK